MALWIALISVTILGASCGGSKDAVYFSNIDTARFAQVPVSKFNKPIIQTDDILNISVQTVDIINPLSLNGAISPSTAVDAQKTESSSTSSGYLVNEEGNVELPMLGAVKLAGLTTSEATLEIKSKASKYYKDPTVQVRFANYKITVLGEVTRPSTYILPNERVTVLDAISMAGDLTIYGKRKNVMLMRDNGDKKDIVRLDLTSTTLMSSPYYYLKQNDVLYVEPTKGKIAINNTNGIRLASLGFSVIALIFTAIRVF